MGITGGFGTLIDLITGKPRKWYMRSDGVKRWASNDQPCDAANETDLWRCTVCGRAGTVGRCCGEETREPLAIGKILRHRYESRHPDSGPTNCETLERER